MNTEKVFLNLTTDVQRGKLLIGNENGTIYLFHFNSGLLRSYESLDNGKTQQHSYNEYYDQLWTFFCHLKAKVGSWLQTRYVFHQVYNRVNPKRSYNLIGLASTCHSPVQYYKTLTIYKCRNIECTEAQISTTEKKECRDQCFRQSLMK